MLMIYGADAGYNDDYRICFRPARDRRSRALCICRLMEFVSERKRVCLGIRIIVARCGDQSPAVWIE